MEGAIETKNDLDFEQFTGDIALAMKMVSELRADPAWEVPRARATPNQDPGHKETAAEAQAKKKLAIKSAASMLIADAGQFMELDIAPETYDEADKDPEYIRLATKRKKDLPFGQKPDQRLETLSRRANYLLHHLGNIAASREIEQNEGKVA